jgi:hypothetical protein
VPEIKQFPLAGEGLSYRGVRLRVPDPDDLDEVMISVAKDAAGDGVRFAYLIPRLMLQRCLVAVTEPGIGKEKAEEARKAAIVKASEEAEAEFREAQKKGKAPDDLKAIAQANMLKVASAATDAAVAVASNALLAGGEGIWQPVTAEQMMIKDGPRSFAKLFSTKDYTTLRAIVQTFYDARVGDADAILGKALAVSVG